MNEAKKQETLTPEEQAYIQKELEEWCKDPISMQIVQEMRQDGCPDKDILEFLEACC